MARFGKEDYIKIYNKYGVDKVWSFSKVETYIQDHYEYFLKYIKKVPEDRNDSAYGDYGTLTHDIIEDYYNDKIKKEDLISIYDKKTVEFEIIGKKFDRTDEQKNEKIKLDYDICIKHYLQNIKKPTTNFKTELPVVLELEPGIVMIGYIDLIELDNGSITITDFKTSTKFSSADMKTKTAQLMLYAEAIRNKQNLPDFSTIKIQYNFLKYITVKYMQLNGTEKSRDIKRSEIGSSLSSVVKTFMNKAGYDENTIASYISQIENENSIDSLPEDIRNKFSINDCIVPVELSSDIIKEFKENFISTVKEIENLEEKYQLTLDENVFWDECTTAKSFYFANLSGYSMDVHKPYKQYLVKNGLLVDTLRKQEQDILVPIINNVQNNTDTSKTIDDKWKDLFGE